MPVFGIVTVVERQDLVLERQRRTRVDFETEVELERASARLLGVEVDLPRLTHGVGLDEVALVVDVEAVVSGMVLQVGDEACDIEDGHPHSLPVAGTAGRAGYQGPSAAAGRYAHAVSQRPTSEQLRLVDLLDRTVEAVRGALEDHHSRNPEQRRDPGERDGQYRLDLVADDAALAVLRAAGVGVLSEESGLEDPGNDIVVVIDPVDGSTNASRRIPWYATSICAVDADGLSVALVENLATGVRYTAVRGGGAFRDGAPLRPGVAHRFEEAFLVLNGYAPQYLNWRQYRSLGATALDLCSVADGSADATIDCAHDALGPWDYLGAALILQEAGAHIADAHGRNLVVLEHEARRTPVSACTAELFDAALIARKQMSW